MTSRKISLVVEPEHYAAIGEIAAQWSAMEATLQEIIWDFADLGTEVGRIITTHMTMHQRLDVILSFCHEHFPDQIRDSKFCHMARKIRNDLSAKRNRYIHSEWFETTDDGQVVGRYARARGKLNPGYYEEPLRNLIVAEDEISDMHYDLQCWQGAVISPD